MFGLVVTCVRVAMMFSGRWVRRDSAKSMPSDRLQEVRALKTCKYVLFNGCKNDACVLHIDQLRIDSISPTMVESTIEQGCSIWSSDMYIINVACLHDVGLGAYAQRTEHLLSPRISTLKCLQYYGSMNSRMSHDCNRRCCVHSKMHVLTN